MLSNLDRSASPKERFPISTSPHPRRNAFQSLDALQNQLFVESSPVPEGTANVSPASRLVQEQTWLPQFSSIRPPKIAQSLPGAIGPKPSCTGPAHGNSQVTNSNWFTILIRWPVVSSLPDFPTPEGIIRSDRVETD
jgi:hypothetical protein